MPLAEQAVTKAQARLIPFMCLLYLISNLDRNNVAFAALTMNKALGLTATQYGFGAGLFFLGYMAAEIPSNLIQTKVGARRWIARIMITWGLASTAMALAVGAHSYYTLRIALGVAEGGFFPGMVYYITLWFPRAYRGRVFGRFMLAIPLSALLGGPIASLAFAHFEGALGLASWQWLFIIEGVPAVLVGVSCLWFLTDRPAHATWLTKPQRDALESLLAQEAHEIHAHRSYSLLQGMTNPRVLLLSFLMFCAQGTSYTFIYFLPQIIKGLGVSNTTVGLITMLPAGIGVVSMLLWTRFADTRPDRAVPLAIAMAVAGTGYLVVGLATGNPAITIIAICAAALGSTSITPLLWSLPTTFLTGVTAAGSFAVIGTVGASSGFVAPALVGWAKDAFGGFNQSIIFVACAIWLAALLVLGFCRSLAVHAAAPAEVAKV